MSNHFSTLGAYCINSTTMVAANSIPGNSFGITVPYHMFETFPPRKCKETAFLPKVAICLFIIIFFYLAWTPLIRDNSAHFLGSKCCTVYHKLLVFGHWLFLANYSIFGITVRLAVFLGFRHIFEKKDLLRLSSSFYG